MIGLVDRQALARDIHIAQRAGARLLLACDIAGIALPALPRWKAVDGLVSGDGRPLAVRATPSHALSEAECVRVLVVADEPRFAAAPPACSALMLADEGICLASASSFNRVLRAHRQAAHRGRAKVPKQQRPPATRIATASCQVWCWNIMTYLPAQELGRRFHLSLILELYSRKIDGREAHDSDHADHAARLVRSTALAMFHGRGVKLLYSRTRVSDDDNAYAESLFRTVRYRLEFPVKGFVNLDDAPAWAIGFVRWYNIDHRHCGIRYVSPAQRNAGENQSILAGRLAVYASARELNPARWSGNTRNWSSVGVVTLSSERDCVVKSHSADDTIQLLAA